MSDDTSELTQEARWDSARKYCSLYGSIPASFSTLIRALMNDQKKGEGTLAYTTKAQMARLLNGDSMKAPFYFAVKTFKPKNLNGMSGLDAKSMAMLLAPLELGAFLGTLYLYRRARKLCEPDLWQPLYETLRTRMEVGGLIGAAIPNIGTGLGMLAGGMREIAMGAFIIHDKKGFKEYRRHCKQKKCNYDYEYELGRWGCSHVDLACSLVLNLGFGTETSEAFFNGMNRDQLGPERPDRMGYAVKLVEVWIDSLMASGKAPDIVHSGNFYPVKDDLAVLIEASSKVKSVGSQFNWLDRAKEDVNPQNTPELVHVQGAGTQEAEGTEQVEEILEEMA